jgi:hypothetical protein
MEVLGGRLGADFEDDPAEDAATVCVANASVLRALPQEGQKRLVSEASNPHDAQCGIDVSDWRVADATALSHML